jgi:hypothetical protein
MRSIHFFVIAGLVPAIHVLARKEDVDARDKPAHDAEMQAGHVRCPVFRKTDERKAQRWFRRADPPPRNPGWRRRPPRPRMSSCRTASRPPGRSCRDSTIGSRAPQSGSRICAGSRHAWPCGSWISASHAVAARPARSIPSRFGFMNYVILLLLLNYVILLLLPQ